MSWQSTMFCHLLRWKIKRTARLPIDIAVVRKRMGTPRRRALRVKKGFRVMALTGAGLTVEKVEAATSVSSRVDLAILYLHGGGYVFGSPQTHRQLTQALAAQTGAPVFAPDYRLAPEHVFPAALDDAVAAYRWLARAEPGRRIVLAGDSAGGGLALATAVALRDQVPELAAPVALVLFSPWTDLGGTGGSNVANSESCAMFTNASIRATGQMYLAGADPADPRGSPLFADLHGLPPMQIFAAAEEVLLDDSRRLATKARDQGNAVELHVVIGVPHVWPLFARLLPEGRASLLQVGAFIRRVCRQPIRP